jgi:hypothetical protein
MARQSLLQQLLATATSLAADVGAHMTPHHPPHVCFCSQHCADIATVFFATALTCAEKMSFLQITVRLMARQLLLQQLLANAGR